MKDKPQKLLIISIAIYLLMVSGTFALNLLRLLDSRRVDLPASMTKLDIIESVEKEVDRSYSRFFTQFNFALFLIGVSVWILRQSVIDQLRKDVGENLQKELEEKIHQDVMQQVEKRRLELLQRDYELEV